jgi:hypothetical protein
LSFGASVPVDHLTACAWAGRGSAAIAAAADTAFRTSRRFQDDGVIKGLLSTPARSSGARAYHIGIRGDRSSLDHLDHLVSPRQ